MKPLKIQSLEAGLLIIFSQISKISTLIDQPNNTKKKEKFHQNIQKCCKNNKINEYLFKIICLLIFNSGNFINKNYILFMYVNKPELVSNNHLIAWVSFEGQNLGYKSAIYTLNSVLETGVAGLILRDIDEAYFCSANIQQNRIQQIYRLIQTYLSKQHGKRVKVSLKNKILDGSIQELVKLLIYCCLHSKKKEQYVERVIHLEQDIQSSIMIATQYIGAELYSIEDLNQVLIRLQQLQNEVQMLKTDLNISSVKQQAYQKLVQQLEQQLKKKENQIKVFKAQKQKVIETLELTSFDEYLTSFQRLQQENRIINKYVEQLEDNNRDHQLNQQQLVRDIENQTQIILDLNQTITVLKQRINTIKLQSSVRFSLDDTCDISRSFGAQLPLILQKQNLSNKKEQKRKSLLTNDLWLLQQSSFQLKTREEALQQQMRQLRKYNSDLIHKLETVYKTHKTLIVETGLIKQKNQNLINQNKFYKKQIAQLKKIHQRMELQMLSGMI